MLLLLFLAAVLAGYIDVLVGGGGLLTIPALLLAGVPPVAALGTNKLQAVVGSGTSTIKLLRLKRIEFKRLRRAFLWSLFGAVSGTVVVQFIHPGVLNYLIPAVIVFIALYFLFKPKAVHPRTERISQTVYERTAIPAIGFYDGMFGPATGSFFVLAGVSLRGLDILSSTMTAKAYNFASNFGSLIVFIAFGQLVWWLGGLMMAGQFIGASLGTRTLIRIDPSLLRYLVVAMSFLVLLAWLAREF